MPRVKLANGSLRDQIKQELFDSYVQAAGESPVGLKSFFTDVQGKAKHLTNMRQNQLLENQVSYLVQGIGFNAICSAAGNSKVLPLVVDHSDFKLVIGEKIYWEGALRTIAGNISQEGDVLVQLGSHDSAKYSLAGNASVAIPPLQSFKCEVSTQGMLAADIVLATPAADTQVIYRCSLMGLLRRPVQ
jgi:hypothetical protein